jgi:hypothetical protein
MKIDVKKYAIEGASRLLLNGHLWRTVKQLCLDVAANTDLSNSQRREAVKDDLKIIFKDTASILLNLAIELGALYVSVVFPQFSVLANKVADGVQEATK